LNTLITPADASVELNAAVGLNDRGEIVVQGTLPNGDQHAFLLIPCDENHTGVEGCDYSLAEPTTTVSRPSQVAGDTAGRAMLPLSMRRVIGHTSRTVGTRN